ncbi:cullin-2 [Bradysia coprophila]|uniref:cullin-2 n=1 Tax=Bradysia coprophila TaxID=38358 RepID=UPI00187DA2EE|nr:cullin-2 [Bradysia coprophila]XP_037031221.1 cullin-2 [Bradysia coprophila]
MSLKPKNVNFDETWQSLRETVKEVITLAQVDRSIWNHRFGDVYALCVAYPVPFADRLYQETKQFLENHVQNFLATQVAPPGRIDEDSGANDVTGSLLQRYYTAWNEYSKGISYLNYLYQYLNQQHIKKQRMSEAEIIYGNASLETQELMEIGELGLDIWRVYMIQSLGDELVKQILNGIKEDRIGSNFNPSFDEVLRGSIHSFVQVQDYQKKGNLKMYQELFETPMLEASGEFYRVEAFKLLQTCSVSQYMEELIKKLEDENKRAQKYLHNSSISKLRKQCEERMITDHLDFLYSECKEMVSQEKRADLSNMYILLKPIPDGLKNLIQIFLDHIKNEGTETISTLKGENIHIQFVENMLQVHHKYEQLIAHTFKNDPLFLSALDKACASVINKRMNEKQACRSAELVAKYCDSLLKKSKSTENEIDSKLTNSITIFKYIEDKDVYQKFYSRMLAKRLIHELSQSMDAEEAMINRLKQACGYEFTNKLHRMFTDISVSTDLNNKFNSYLKETCGEIGVNLSIKVLQAGAWPLGPTQVVIPFSIPQEFERSIRMYENFYHLNFNGRKLTWLHHLCHGELKTSYLNKEYIIIMQTYQMAMLLLFESINQMTCKEMQETLQLNADTFQKHLQGLLEAKLLIASSEALDDDTEVKLNLDYSNKRTKFKITAALQKETPQEVEHTLSSVDDDRKLYLQAAIVRIMKSRKILKHNALIQEILSQSRVSFAPSIPMIKKCIESLIDKQYIERTPSAGDEYSYVA